MSLYQILRIMTSYILRAYHLPGTVANALRVLPPLFLIISDKGGIVPFHGGGGQEVSVRCWPRMAVIVTGWGGAAPQLVLVYPPVVSS